MNTDFITGILTSASIAAIWQAIQPMATLTAITILFAFAYRVLNHSVKTLDLSKSVSPSPRKKIRVD